MNKKWSQTTISIRVPVRMVIVMLISVIISTRALISVSIQTIVHIDYLLWDLSLPTEPYNQILLPIPIPIPIPTRLRIPSQESLCLPLSTTLLGLVKSTVSDKIFQLELGMKRDAGPQWPHTLDLGVELAVLSIIERAHSVWEVLESIMGIDTGKGRGSGSGILGFSDLDLPGLLLVWTVLVLCPVWWTDFCWYCICIDVLIELDMETMRNSDWFDLLDLKNGHNYLVLTDPHRRLVQVKYSRTFICMTNSCPEVNSTS